MLLKKTYFQIILILVSLSSFAQLDITFPMEKAVFQRNSNNQANLYIGGTYTSLINSVEARLLNAFNNNVVINWTNIQNNPTGGTFRGFLSNVNGGWYRLEVRGLLNGNLVSSAVLNRVGIGEVFLISGQSNAQGLEGYQGEVGANDERVLSHNYNGTLCNISTPNYPNFTQIFSNTSTRSYMSKTSLNPWCYGKLGDNLVNRLGVPVVFFNAASTATSTLNWKQSSDGLATTSHYSFSQYCLTVGMPFANFKKTINYYVSMFGVRAILWHQGETDNYAQLSYSDTYNNLEYVINKTRAEINGTIPWVVAKASVFDKNANGGAGNPNPNTISAQQNIVNHSNKIFGGPLTDDILGSNRSDEVHFHSAGLIELANRWDASLDANFFSNATPIPAKPMPYITINCASQTHQNLSAPNGYSTYKWVRVDNGNEDFDDPAEANTQTITRSNGTYRCYVTDANGNISVSQTVVVQNVAQFCGCSQVTYLSSITPTSSINGWGPIEMDKSNGENGANDGNTITLNGVTYARGIGVHANSEVIFNLNGNYGRLISDLGVDDEVNGTSCGGTVRFEIYKDGVLSYTSPVLNTTSQTIKLNIDVTGVNVLKLVVNDAGDGNCADHADWAGIRLHCPDSQPPTAPVLSYSNLGQSCLRLSWTQSSDNMEVEKYQIFRDNVQIAEVDANILHYDINGLNAFTFYTFYVRAKDFSNNFSNNSNTLNITTLPNPVILSSYPTINIGQNVLLTAANCSNGTIQWSNGATGSPYTVSPTSTTTYFATCLTNGCTSPISNLVTITVIPNCTPTYNLVSPTHDLSGPVVNLTYQASDTISATNDILNRANVHYKAGKSITLNPGFEASGSVVFRASISNCPN